VKGEGRRGQISYEEQQKGEGRPQEGAGCKSSPSLRTMIVGVCPPNDIVAETKDGEAKGKKAAQQKGAKGGQKEKKVGVRNARSWCKMLKLADRLLLRRDFVFSSAFVCFSRCLLLVSRCAAAS